MRELDPAWPPIDSRSITSVRRPSEEAYTAAASPDGPAPTTVTSNSREPCRRVRGAVGVGDLDVGRVDQHPAVALHDDGTPASAARRTSSRTCAPSGEVGGVEDERHPVAGEQAAQLAGAGVARVGDDRQLPGERGVRAHPLVEELGDRPVEELVGRPPRLEGVVVDLAEADAAAQRLGGGVDRPLAPGDEQQPPGSAGTARAPGRAARTRCRRAATGRRGPAPPARRDSCSSSAGPAPSVAARAVTIW